MNILLISYGDAEFDGRLRSLFGLFSKLGNVISFTRGSRPLNCESKVCDTNTSYFVFIIEAIKFSSKIPVIDLLVLDNRKATIPGIIIQKRCKPKTTIQDCRELYLFNEVRHISGKIGCIFEKRMVRKADIVICANHERAEIMQKEYQLKNTPLSYQNIRKLQYGSREDILRAKEKIDLLLHDNEIRIVSTSGCSISRTNDVLVSNLNKIKATIRLYLVGNNTEEERRIIKKLINDNNLANVEIVDQLNQSELKYLISHCQIGIVNYGQYDANNKYCASGKLFEFLYEGLPVVTTTNPPLSAFCAKYGVGVSDDAYCYGISKVIEEYETFKQNVVEYISKNTVEDNDKEFLETIESFVIGRSDF